MKRKVRFNAEGGPGPVVLTLSDLWLACDSLSRAGVPDHASVYVTKLTHPNPASLVTATWEASVEVRTPGEEAVSAQSEMEQSILREHAEDVTSDGEG